MNRLALRSVLFTDLGASTALFSMLPRGQAERVRAAHLDALSLAIRNHAGEEVQQLGEGVMAVFQSASAALAAAVAMQRTVSDMARRERLPLEMRAGISTGDAVRTNDDWFGPPVVCARRLRDSAGPRQILADDLTERVARTRNEHVISAGPCLQLKGLREPVQSVVVGWAPPERTALRVVLADDAVLLRESIGRLLAEDGMDVVAQANDVDELLRLVDEHAPDVVVSDIRMPGLDGRNGIDAAMVTRRNHPGTAVLLLSQHLDRAAAARLLNEQPTGVGYLLKERALDVTEFTSAVRRVAAGGVALDASLSTATRRR